MSSLIEFPCRFPVKVMGHSVEEFIPCVLDLARTADPTFDEKTVEIRSSSGGSYVGVTVTVLVHSQDQLDDFYRSLTGHPLVKVVL